MGVASIYSSSSYCHVDMFASSYIYGWACLQGYFMKVIYGEVCICKYYMLVIASWQRNGPTCNSCKSMAMGPVSWSCNFHTSCKLVNMGLDLSIFILVFIFVFILVLVPVFILILFIIIPFVLVWEKIIWYKPFCQIFVWHSLSPPFSTYY